MNEQHDTTAPAVAATFDPGAFETRLFDLKMLASAASMLANTALFENGARLQGLVAITPLEAEQIAFLVVQVEDRAREAAAAFDLHAFAETPTATVSSSSAAKSVDPAMPDFETAFYDLEEPIQILSRRLKAADFIFGAIDTRSISSGPDAPVKVSPDERDALHSTMRDAVQSIDDLSSRYSEICKAAFTAAFATLPVGKAPRDEIGDAPELGVPDPLLKLIRAYQASIAAFNRLEDESEAAVRATFGPLLSALTSEAVPQPTTMEGALAGLRLVAKDAQENAESEMVVKVLPAVLRYLEASHVQ